MTVGRCPLLYVLRVHIIHCGRLIIFAKISDRLDVIWLLFDLAWALLGYRGRHRDRSSGGRWGGRVLPLSPLRTPGEEKAPHYDHASSLSSDSLVILPCLFCCGGRHKHTVQHQPNRVHFR